MFFFFETDVKLEKNLKGRIYHGIIHHLKLEINHSPLTTLFFGTV